MYKKIIIVIAIITFSVSFVQAQTDTKGLKVKLKSQAGKRWAICIGINNYVDNKLNTLKKASNDAYGLSAILKEQGDFEVSTFSDRDSKGEEQSFSSTFFPTKRNIEDFLSNIVTFKDFQPNDLVVFSFSGHGISDSNGKGYLLPIDWNSEKPYESAIAVSYITDCLNNLEISKSLLLIDACREEMSRSRSVDTMSRLYDEKFERAQVSAVFYATKEGGFSYEDPNSDYGAFTRFLIEGLQGEGDKDNDELVTFRELSTYVEDGLSAWARENGFRQRPYTRLLEEQSGDLALTIAGRGSFTQPPIVTPNLPEKTEPERGTGTVIKDADFAPEMVYIPAGEFVMGSDKGEDNEKPIHKVYIDSFYIGKYEVTQWEWRQVMETNPSHFKGDDLPVEQVSWNDVQEYLKKLSQMTGKKYRLPTEAEWEYTCRAGSTTEYYYGNNSNNLDEYAWYKDNSEKKTHPVGKKKPNAWGLHDMHGNVNEWCQDRYGRNYYSISSTDNPAGPTSGSKRVVRGGSWSYGTGYMRSAFRYNRGYSRFTFSYLGFRCVREK